MHGTSLLSNPGQFGRVSFSQVSRDDDEELSLLNQFGFSKDLNSLNPHELAKLRYQLQPRGLLTEQI